MKKPLLFIVFVAASFSSLAQGKNISLQKKSLAPYVTQAGDTIRVGDKIVLAEGSGTNGQFLYVQVLNAMNEPIKPADSRMASMQQPVLFFKEKDGVTYLFTKYFVLNTEAALKKSEAKHLSKR